MLAHDHAYGAAIIARTRLGCKLIPELSSNAAVCVEFADMQLFSAYCKPALVGLGTILGPILGNPRFQRTRAVIGMDANAHNPLWNSTFTDDKGRELEDLMLSNQLDLLNVPAAELAWVPAGTSFIDVTLAGDEVFQHLQNWKYLDFHSLSDHPYIYFTIAGHHHPSRPIQLLIPNM